MKNLKLHEIIELNEVQTNSILIELMVPYAKSLYAYYKNAFFSEPVLMIVSVTNSTSYARIVPVDEFTQNIEDYIGSKDIENENDEDKISQYELINFQSIMLQDLKINFKS